MKKIVIIGLTITFILSGCGTKKNITKEPEAKKAKLPVKEASLMTWLTKGKSVICDIELPAGKITVMSKNQKVLMSGMPMPDPESPGKTAKGYSLSDSEWMYMWSGKRGTKMNLQKLKEMDNNNETEVGQKTWQDNIKEWEKGEVKYNCRQEDLPDDKFTPPIDVKFVDMTEMLSNMQDMGKQLQTNNNNQTPDFENVDIEALKRQAEEMQKKYGQ